MANTKPRYECSLTDYTVSVTRYGKRKAKIETMDTVTTKAMQIARNNQGRILKSDPVLSTFLYLGTLRDTDIIVSKS